MPLIYVTGNSGAGKSTVCSELKHRGYEAYDADEHDMSAWYDKAGHKLKAVPELVDRNAAWYERHDWVMSLDRVQGLADKASSKLIFLSGTAANDVEVLKLFAQVFYLTTDKDTLKHRISIRTNNDFGKQPHELNNILSWHDDSEADFRALGATMIDATHPVKVVVDEILSSINHKLIQSNFS